MKTFLLKPDYKFAFSASIYQLLYRYTWLYSNDKIYWVQVIRFLSFQQYILFFVYLISVYHVHKNTNPLGVIIGCEKINSSTVPPKQDQIATSKKKKKN